HLVTNAKELPDRNPNGRLAIELQLEDRRPQRLGQIVGGELHAQLADRTGTLHGGARSLTRLQFGSERLTLEVSLYIERVTAELLLDLIELLLSRFEAFHGERLDLGPLGIGAVINLVINRFATYGTDVHKDVGAVS